MDPNPIVTEDTLKSFLDAFNRHDLVDIMSFFSKHPVLEMPRGPQPWGTRAEGKAEVQALLRKVCLSLVGRDGLEPSTSALSARRSAS